MVDLTFQPSHEKEEAEPEPQFTDAEWRRGVAEFLFRHPGMKWSSVPRKIQLMFVAQVVEQDRISAATDLVLAAFAEHRQDERWEDLSRPDQMLFIGQVLSDREAVAR